MPAQLRIRSGFLESAVSGSGEGFSLFDDAFDFFEEFAEVERLDDVVIDPAGVGPCDVLGLASCGEHDDGDVLSPGLSAKGFEHFVSVHDGHNDIQEDDVGGFFFGLLEALPAVVSGYDVVFVHFKPVFERLNDVGFVVDHEDFRLFRFFPDSEKIKHGSFSLLCFARTYRRIHAGYLYAGDFRQLSGIFGIGRAARHSHHRQNRQVGKVLFERMVNHFFNFFPDIVYLLGFGFIDDKGDLGLRGLKCQVGAVGQIKTALGEQIADEGPCGVSDTDIGFGGFKTDEQKSDRPVELIGFRQGFEMFLEDEFGVGLGQ